VAALLAARRGFGERDLLLAPAARGPAAAPRAAHRPAAPGDAELPRRRAAGAPARRAHPAGRGLCPARGGDAVHGAARRLPGAAGPAQRAGRSRGGLTRCRTQPAGDRGADRVLRQHPGAARRPVWRPARRALVPRAARPGARNRARRLSAPGSALREAGRGAGAGEEPLLQRLVPGAVDHAERPCRETGDSRPRAAARGRGQHNGEVRHGALSRRDV